MVPICRAIVAFPAVPAPTAVIAARIACRVLDSLAHHSGKRNQACATRLALNFGSDLSRAGAKSCKALCRPHPKKKAWVEINEFLI
jgi:fumarylacetoacetate (FAA) hydrolase family protein